MNLFSLNNSGVCLIICFLIARAGGQSLEYLPDDLFISCGSHRTHTDGDSIEWIGDANPKFTNLLQVKGSSTTSRGVDPVPYTTARISSSRFSYTFHLKPGLKLIRLHFNSIQYGKKLQDLFSVEAGNFILLSDFSPSKIANVLGVKSVVKEFFLSVEENKELEIVFLVESRLAKDTYAFINGIVITSVPLHLSYFDGGIKVVGQRSLAYIDNSTVLEIVHREHIKTNSAADDSRKTFGMLAAGEHRAGKGMNKITWNVSVDLGFSYLVRLHFCQVALKMAEIVRIKFTVLINEMFAASTDDVFRERGYSGIPLHDDHMVIIKGPKQHGKRNISISLLLNSASINEYGPFKGFEIVKLSDPYNSLASMNPMPQSRYCPCGAQHSLVSVIWEVNEKPAKSITIMIIFNAIAHCVRKFWRAKPMVKERKPSARAASLFRSFQLTELKAATKDFNPLLVLGTGSFGVVYKGDIDNGQVTVAIKKLKCNSRKGKDEFWNQVEQLPELRHVNIVSFIGYCCEQSELVLVYEYMAGGTLADRLYKPDMDSSNRLTWQQRLHICIGAGRGLEYLHTGSGGVIHRDVKTSNILLDSNLVAKIADFGLAKLDNMNEVEVQSHESTNVKGTFGYLDPNYASTRRLTQKSDMYSFGVVLLEVLCGRPAIDESADSITAWARELMSRGEVHLMVDPSLREEIKPESLKTYMEIVEGCLHEEPKKRPAMAQVVPKLMDALKQQKSTSRVPPTEITSVAAEASATADDSASTAGAEARVDPLPKAVKSGRPWKQIKLFVRKQMLRL